MSEVGSGDAGTGRGRGRGRGGPKTQTQFQKEALPTPGPTPGAESSPTPKKSLRKPRPETQAKLFERLHSSGSGDDVTQVILGKAAEKSESIQSTSFQNTAVSVANSKLSATAAEFVPRGYQNPPKQPVPVQGTSEYVEPVRVNVVQGTSEYDNNGHAIDHFHYTLNYLKSNPGNFDEQMRPLVHVLRDNITIENALDDLVSIIFEQAIGEFNFQYMGAKICNYLSSNLSFTHLPKNSNFRQRLLKKCQKENESRDSNMQVYAHDRVRGFTMFMAELFVNMMINGRHMAVLIKHIHGLLETLLAHPSDENFKCVAKALKLCGAALEDSGTPGDMDSLLVRVKAQGNCRGVKKHIIDMLLSVITLRATNWGRSESPVTISDNSYNFVNAANYQQPDPVFYNTQGQTITRQEAEFSHMDYGIEDYNFTVDQEYTPWSNPDELYYDNFIDGDYEGDPEMDDEIAEAFEKFVLETEAKRHGAI